MKSDRKAEFQLTEELLGRDKQKAVVLFEDCPFYDVKKVLFLSRLIRDMRWKCDISEIPEKAALFKEKLKELEIKEKPEELIPLWPEGKIPSFTDYRENPDFRYNHDPDFVPHLIPMLLPPDVTPKGAVILCAGGDHAESCLFEGYQVALDFMDLGYQCFQLLNRTNNNPWNIREAGADAARAVRYVRAHAALYRVPEDRIAFAGFSNGGLTGEGLLQYYSGEKKVKDIFPDYEEDSLDSVSANIDAFLCIYGQRFKGASFDYEGVVYPPTFLAVGREDFALANFHALIPDLLAHGIPIEVHSFAGTPHGEAGTRIEHEGRSLYPNFDQWISLADAFMADLYAKRDTK